MEENTKICADCGKRKPLSEFYLNKNEHDGHSRICKIDAKLREEKRRRSRGILPKNNPKIDDEHRRCSMCGHIKHNSEFAPRTDRKDSYRSECRYCTKKQAEYKRRQNGVLPYNKSVLSSAYVGIFVGEDCIADSILRQWYDNVIHMPPCTKGHDFLVLEDGNLIKVEVKTSSKLKKSDSSDRWQFGISKNMVADKFLFIALNDFAQKSETSLNVAHVWYIPSYEIDTSKSFLTIGETTVDKWKKWEKIIEV